MVVTRGGKLGKGTGFGLGEDGEAQFTLSASHGHAVAYEHENAAGFKYNQGAKARNIGYQEEQSPVLTADAGHPPAVAYTMKIRCGCEGGGKGPLVQEDMSATLATGNDQTLFVPYTASSFGQYLEGETGTLRASGGDLGGGSETLAVNAMQVRKLTPRECERLQGFPDDWTKVSYRDKPEDDCPDGPRYKAIGNSMAVPVMRFIGERILKVAKPDAWEGEEQCLNPQGTQSDRVFSKSSVFPSLVGGGKGNRGYAGGSVLDEKGVRRLTPVEWERLQGFPDDWTKIEWNGKPEEQCPDARRYKAIGNSMAVPVMRLIGERILQSAQSQDAGPEKASTLTNI